MSTFIQPGMTVTLTAPGAGVTVGVAVQIGQLFVVAQSTATVGVAFEGTLVGVHTLPKDNTQAWTEGATLYWDASGAELSTTATGKQLVGVAAVAAGSADTTGSILLLPSGRADEA